MTLAFGALEILLLTYLLTYLQTQVLNGVGDHGDAGIQWRSQEFLRLRNCIEALRRFRVTTNYGPR